MGHRYARSPLWAHHNETHVTSEAVADLAGFKSNGVNFKIALWDPALNGVRYLKTLIFNLSAGLSDANRARLRRIDNRDVGDPITVTYGGDRVCLDYLQAVLELEFIADRVTLDGATVLEIGGGYGRTCHTILSNHDLDAYHIVDLENSLHLARNYLAAVLTEGQLKKVHFHPTDEVDGALSGMRFDLCVNIDSFAEMNPETVRAYLGFVAAHCRHLYVKNPVGKYLDKSLDGHSQGRDVVDLALRTGPLREIIDIHDDRAVAAQSRRFLAAYLPGDEWTCVAEGATVPWTYYWQAMYRRTEENVP
ncbi:putative sugar O-methyltransferase [Polymorphospora sp. NPDC051019]|uniref:putative sugar O-methyltransferase n=1 Tax=Polymorphospora sp. NPDC051019 TaxID=3155725 RepID=UPI0034356EDC